MSRSLNRALSTYKDAYQLCAYGTKNIINFIRHGLVPYQGLQTLVPRFYASINDSTDPPVSRELALAVANTEETVFGKQGLGDFNRRPTPTYADEDLFTAETQSSQREASAELKVLNDLAISRQLSAISQR